MNAANQNNDAENSKIGEQPQPMEVPKANIEPSTNTENRQPVTKNDRG
jgi:hypothetical protein